jgi:hypothetical protein
MSHPAFVVFPQSMRQDRLRETIGLQAAKAERRQKNSRYVQGG